MAISRNRRIRANPSGDIVPKRAQLYWASVARSSIAGGSFGEARFEASESQPRVNVVSWMHGTRLERLVFSSPRLASTSSSARRAFHVHLQHHLPGFAALPVGVRSGLKSSGLQQLSAQVQRRSEPTGSLWNAFSSLVVSHGGTNLSASSTGIRAGVLIR